MNSSTTKKTLTISIISIFVCIAALVGATYAWFTDQASTKVNTIQAGTLDIGLYSDTAFTEETSLEGKTLNFVKADGSETILWEPGCTYELPTVYVKNNGNLAAKFIIEVTGIEGDAELNEVIEWTFSYGAGSGVSYPDYDSENGINYGLTPGGYLPVTISGHMDENAGNKYQGMSIDGISITVYATQLPSEYDSTTNMYDAGATYNMPPSGNWSDYVAATANDIAIDETSKTVKIYTAAGLAQFAKNVNIEKINYADYTITLEADINLAGHIWTPIGQTTFTQFCGNFDGNNHTISNLYVDSSAETNEYYASGLFGWVEVHNRGVTTIKSLTIEAANVSGKQYVGAVAGYIGGNLSIQNCKVTNSSITAVGAGDKAGAVVGYMNGSNTVTNCSANNCTVAAGRDAGQIVGCLVSNHNNVSGCTATNVTVSATGEGTGANINNAIIGRTS